MGRNSMTTRDELVAAVRGRYTRKSWAERGRILDEFAAVNHTVKLPRWRSPAS
jgi:hypothetical protein